MDITMNYLQFSSPILFITFITIIHGADSSRVDIIKTGDYERDTDATTLPFAEPYKLTTLQVSIDDMTDINDFKGIRWDISFLPKMDELWPEEQAELLAEEGRGHSFLTEINNEESSVFSTDHTFKLPGMYKISVSGTHEDVDESTGKDNTFVRSGKRSKPGEKSKSQRGKKKSILLASDEIRVAYARRDVIDLSPTDWDNYVDAIWALKSLSSAEGKRRFNCPNFYNIDVFTTIHGVHSANKTCDQNHFSIMQESAHQAWMTLLERALQCIHPSIALPFYNVAKDVRNYYDATVGVKSILNSPIYGPDYYGGGHSNWDERRDPYDPYYVTDGRFAKFPLRQNRTGLCEDAAELSNDKEFLDHCKSIMEGDYLGWRNKDPTTSGIWETEPRDETTYKYVSARRWYVYDDVGDEVLPNIIPTYGMIQMMISIGDTFRQLQYLLGPNVHGYAHIILGGMWGGGIDKTTKTLPDSPLFPNQSILSLLRNRSYLLTFAWWDEFGHTRGASGCYSCTRDECAINMVNAVPKNCYNIQNSFEPPTTNQMPYWTEYAVKGNLWYNHLTTGNTGSWMKFALYGFGAHHSNSGTFSRTAWANQDPMFYAHHTFTFLLRDFIFETTAERGQASPPLYGIDDDIKERGVPECPGHNPSDVTVYKNIVRYKVGQEPGSSQSWNHILEMWTPERRDYEWVINDEYITDYDNIVRKDKKCDEGCFDEPEIIGRLLPYGTPASRICTVFLKQMQLATGLSKDDICQLKVNEIKALGREWIPDQFTVNGNECSKTCGYCSNTCGDP